MNDIELRHKVYQLKKNGYGYKKIANELSITVSAARYLCQKTTDEVLLESECENCNLRIKSLKGKKKKRFCSDKCRWQWWNKNSGSQNRTAFYSFICKQCDKEFTVYGNKNRSYCCHDCYIKSKTNKDKANHEA